jgi:hypothetical protein
VKVESFEVLPVVLAESDNLRETNDAFVVVVIFDAFVVVVMDALVVVVVNEKFGVVQLDKFKTGRGVVVVSCAASLWMHVTVQL